MMRKHGGRRSQTQTDRKRGRYVQSRPANGQADDDIVVNEVNTMPGFTPISLYPRMWDASGVSYRELVDSLVREALTRPTGLR